MVSGPWAAAALLETPSTPLLSALLSDLTAAVHMTMTPLVLNSIVVDLDLVAMVLDSMAVELDLAAM